MSEEEWRAYWSERLPEQMVEEAVAISMGEITGCTSERKT